MSWPSSLPVYNGMIGDNMEDDNTYSSSQPNISYIQQLSVLETLPFATLAPTTSSYLSTPIYTTPAPCYINTVMSINVLFAKIYSFLPDYIQHILSHARVCKLWYMQANTPECWRKVSTCNGIIV